MTWENMTKTQKLIWLKKLNGGGEKTETTTGYNIAILRGAAAKPLKSIIRQGRSYPYPYAPDYEHPQNYLCNNGITKVKIENGNTVVEVVGTPERIIVSPNVVNVEPVEPYQEGSVVSLFNSYGIDSADTHDLITGEVVRKTRIKALDGSEEYTSDMYDGHLVFRTFFDDAVLRETPLAMECSHTYGLSSLLINGFAQFYAPTGITTVEQFKSFIASRANTEIPFYCLYPLKSPYIERVTPQPLSAYPGICYVTSLFNLPDTYSVSVTVTYYKMNGGNVVGSAIVGTATI